MVWEGERRTNERYRYEHKYEGTDIYIKIWKDKEYVDTIFQIIEWNNQLLLGRLDLAELRLTHYFNIARADDFNINLILHTITLTHVDREKCQFVRMDGQLVNNISRILGVENGWATRKFDALICSKLKTI